MMPSRKPYARASTSTSFTSRKLETRSKVWARSCGSVDLSLSSPGSLRAVLFDAGNTLVFLDYDRMALGVSTALGLPLTGEGLATHAADAASAMESSTGTDRDRAAVYLEALFRMAGVPDARMDE